MKKIPTLFLRDPDTGLRYVTEQEHSECHWVLDGEGVPTRKYDGTCLMFDGEAWWARREVKPGKAPTANFVPVGTDDMTGKTVGWEPVEQSAFAKFHAEAVTLAEEWSPGTYELVGPKVNGNPEGMIVHEMLAHAAAETLLETPRTYDGLAKYLSAFEGEGIVWHHEDGRMAKIKVRDFAPVAAPPVSTP